MTQIITIHDTNYHIEAYGEGPPLVLLHGFTGSTRNWHPHLPADHRVILIDVLGHGRSAKPADPERYRMQNIADDIAALLDALTDAPVNLLGYSMGGRLALYFALHHPVRSLILESASPGLKTASERAERRQRDNALAERIEREGIPAFVDFWENIPLFGTQKHLPKTAYNAQREQRLSNDPVGLANSLRGMGTGQQPNLWPRLGELTMPVLLLAGAEDTKFTALNRAMHAAIPQSELIIVPGAGHTIHLEKPALFDAHVLNFLRRGQ